MTLLQTLMTRSWTQPAANGVAALAARLYRDERQRGRMPTLAECMRMAHAMLPLRQA